ncbi:MAG: AIR synthase-related protein, partial [Aquificaceae bacterium]
VQDFGKTVVEVLLEPTRIYWEDIKKIRGSVRIKAMAHITGGGIRENLIRVLKDGRRAIIEKSSIPKNPIFDWVKSLGNIAEEEMYRTFNMGVGFMLVADKEEAGKVLDLLEDVFLCGRIERGDRDVILV